MIVTAGSTNVSVYYYIVQDASATSPGEPVTGLLFSDIETGGSASYVRQGAARTDLTLITLGAADSAHADGGFILVDDTNMPGLYRCDYPDAAFATGIDQVFLQIVVASANNAVAAPILVDITDVDLRDSVRMGLTSLPNAAADAAGGLPISDDGGLDIDAVAVIATAVGTDGTNLTEAGGDGDQLTAINLPNQTMDITGNLSGSVGSVTAGVTLAAGAVTNASLAGNMEIVFETDFSTNYNTTRNAWVNNYTDIIGTMDAADFGADFITAAKIADNSITSDQFAQTAADKVWSTTSRTLTDGIVKNATFDDFPFQMVLTSDHVTPATGLTVTGQRSIDAGAYTNVAGTIAEISNGTYQIDLTAADTNGDTITYKFSSATADDTFITVFTQ